MSWLLDADILSQPAKRHGDARVIAWLEREKPRSYIAATARRHNLTIVTGNDKHFRRPGLKVFNPFTELSNLE